MTTASTSIWFCLKLLLRWSIGACAGRGDCTISCIEPQARWLDYLVVATHQLWLLARASSMYHWRRPTRSCCSALTPSSTWCSHLDLLSVCMWRTRPQRTSTPITTTRSYPEQGDGLVRLPRGHARDGICASLANTPLGQKRAVFPWPQGWSKWHSHGRDGDGQRNKVTIRRHSYSHNNVEQRNKVTTTWAKQMILPRLWWCWAKEQGDEVSGAPLTTRTRQTTLP